METYWSLGSEIEPSIGILILLLGGVILTAAKKFGVSGVGPFFGRLAPWLLILAGVRLALPLSLAIAIPLLCLGVAMSLLSLAYRQESSQRIELFALLYGLLFLVLVLGFARNQVKVQVATFRMTASSGVMGSHRIEGSPSVQMTEVAINWHNWRPLQLFRVEATPGGTNYQFTDRDWYLGPNGLINGRGLAEHIAKVNGISIVTP